MACPAEVGSALRHADADLVHGEVSLRCRVAPVCLWDTIATTTTARHRQEEQEDEDFEDYDDEQQQQQ